MKLYRFAVLGLFFISSVNAADITIFYSPSCPHCHHARDFIRTELIYEYDDLKVTEINATLSEHRQQFIDTLKKCEFTSGGVPVLVVGEKCFQGYGKSSNDSLRAAVEIDYTDAQKKSADANRATMKKDHDAFVAAHASRTDAIVDMDALKKK